MQGKPVQSDIETKYSKYSQCFAQTCQIFRMIYLKHLKIKRVPQRLHPHLPSGSEQTVHHRMVPATLCAISRSLGSQA